MRASRSALPTIRVVLGAARRVAGFLPEAVLLAALVVGLELVGPYAPHDGADLIALVGVLLVGTLGGAAARAGWLPGLRSAALAVRQRAVVWVRGLQPRYAVAFRPTEDVPQRPDRALLTPALVLAVAGVVLVMAGERVFDGLAFLKSHASYTVYLALLTFVWALQALAVLGGGLATVHWLQGGGRRRRQPPPRSRLLLFSIGWVVALLTLLLLPGAAPLAALLLLAWWRDRSLGDLPVQTYLFCRRDARGRACSIPVHDYLRRAHATIVLYLAVVIVLGQGQRLWIAEWPKGPFAFTTWLGLLSSLCALLLAARVGVHFQRVMGGSGVPPEVPLTPTLWMRLPSDDDPSIANEAWAQYEPWYRIGREHGWLVLRDKNRPAEEFDLVMGDPSDPRRFLPRPPTDDDDARFQLERRFHVVMRRRFYRRFRSLFKKLRAEKPKEGSGYLFCPHVWLVPGVVRDLEPGRQRGSRGAIAGPVFHGPPYAEAFPLRVRRYVGSVLRELQIDIVYFEDAVNWADLRRVLGVAMEIYDQGRSPLQERHFVGVPRVRVVIQEEAAEPEPTRGWLEGGTPDLEPSSPGHARILVVIRDRGGQEEPITPAPADTWIRSPSLV